MKQKPYRLPKNYIKWETFLDHQNKMECEKAVNLEPDIVNFHAAERWTIIGNLWGETKIGRSEDFHNVLWGIKSKITNLQNTQLGFLQLQYKLTSVQKILFPL